jgi:C-methyltransferase C-terminal domain/Putative zinc binding domain/Methyltransferase domain
VSGYRCRSCGAPLAHVFVDLGASPLSNRFLEPEDVDRPEPFYPLTVRVCDRCFLVQLPEIVAAEQIFTDYAYFSSYSDSWLRQCEAYARHAVTRFALTPSSRVLELASNDGYLLQFFAGLGIPVLGVEPAANVAAVAERRGIPTLVRFFGTAAARDIVRDHGPADLLVGNNVLAHVPDLNDFIAGMRLALGSRGVISMEFPHLERLVELNQFDTIYHEHFSYFSLLAVETAFERHDLVLFDVDELPSHGGSLRIYARHRADWQRPVSERVAALRRRELDLGYARLETYMHFPRRVEETKRALLTFLIEAKRAGKQVVGYGAPAKGNTLLNYCGVRTDFLDYTVDRSEHKQGRLLPGTRIPILAPEHLRATRPDYVLILPWNLRDEIVEQMAHVREWGGRFVVPIPTVEILP